MFFKLVVLLCVVVSISSAIPPKMISDAIQLAGKCNGQYPLKMQEMNSALRSGELPTSENGKCFLSCMLEGFGLISDGQINLEKSNEFNKMHFNDNPELLKKANEMSSGCKEEMSKSTEEGCEFAVAAANCMLKNSKELRMNYFHLQHNEEEQLDEEMKKTQH